MNNQEAFDKVATHLLTQRKRSTYPVHTAFQLWGLDDEVCSEKTGWVCAYRGPDGLKCAIGCLIPDEEYSVVLENEPVEVLVRTLGLSRKPVEALQGISVPLLQDLQWVHDYKRPDRWADELRKVAEWYGNLDSSIVDELEQRGEA